MALVRNARRMTALQDQPLISLNGDLRKAPSLPSSSFRRPDQLLQPRLVLDVAPPPVGRPRQPDTVNRVRGHPLPQPAERLIAVSEQRKSDGVLGKDLG